MRSLGPFGIVTATALGLVMSAAAQTKYPAVLDGHVLPAMTLVPAPTDAPPDLQVSGRHAGPPGQRVDTPETVPGVSALSGKPLVETPGRLELARRHQGSTRFIHLAVACAS
ncbi:MAG: hypothetical protein U1E60_28845 [Reyranellaceae bacterium]